MSQETLVYGKIREALISAFPDLWECIEDTFGSYYNPEEETPEAYPIFEEVIRKVVFELLENGQNEGLLTRLFDFFEKMANSADPDIHDLLGIAIVDPLLYDAGKIRRAWRYMGPETKEFTKSAARVQEREQNLPPD